MPRGQISKEVRLQIQVTRLTKSVTKLRSELIRLNRIIKEKDQEIVALKSKLEDKEAQRKQLLSYLYKPNTQDNPYPKPLGKKLGASAYHRPKPNEAEVTETHSFPLVCCPTCQTPLKNPAETIIRYEEDIDLAPRKLVKKYLIPRYWCTRCKDFVKSSHIPPIAHIGPNVMGYILYARYRLRLPLEKIKESLFDLHNFRISEGEITEQLKNGESLFGKEYQAISELIRTAKVVYADETGWRMDGDNWWLWVFATEKGVRYLLEESRGKGIPNEALGSKKDRVIISDGYAVYSKLPGEKQQCWVHLLRAAKLASPILYADLVSLYTLLGNELVKPIKERDPPSFTLKLHGIETKQYIEPLARKVQERIKKHFSQLLTCLLYEGVLPENNTAERALRHQVVMRKIFGGSRSIAGAKAHEVNTSVIETLRKQNPQAPFFEVVLPLLKKRIEERYSGL